MVRVPPGLYAVYLKKANEALANAQKVADPQAGAGDWRSHPLLPDWRVRRLAQVRPGLGAEQSPRSTSTTASSRSIAMRAGQKGSSQSFVTITDKPLTAKMETLAANAAYFEQHAPWADQYKKTQFTPPTVKAVETLIETGDFHVNTIGDNLPNENEIRETVRQQELSVHRRQPRFRSGAGSTKGSGSLAPRPRSSRATSSTDRKPRSCIPPCTK